ncbi:MAG TPA: 2-hydroxyacid dehydrogenase [Bacteroidia bacterium]|jgi:D-3-phosphoglycerate dehydrogenase|nr:2-hydroxyacid dehydrogenase [Bacteroidia bacterium]HRG51318.1 2-hydroxyacid dehydrogenase [Bacteroidia bacterium]
MKILFIDSNHPILHQTLEKSGHTCDLNYKWSLEEIITNIYEYDGIVIRSRIKITKEIIDKATKLKFIARAGAGMENIDTTYAESKGIQCLHAPEGNRDAVAEHALGMLLSLFNNLCRANKEVREGKWIREGNRGVELMGKTVGIIGYGNMGSAFAERLKGFGVTVLVYDKYKKEFGNNAIKEVTLDEIFEKTDVLSLHTPLTDETHYLINDAFIKKFKKNIYIINTARGKSLNTADLVANLKSGKVAGACLDVLEYEMTSFENLDAANLPDAFQYLIQSDKVMLSSHIAGWTHESNEKIARILAEKILAV